MYRTQFTLPIHAKICSSHKLLDHVSDLEGLFPHNHTRRILAPLLRLDGPVALSRSSKGKLSQTQGSRDWVLRDLARGCTWGGMSHNLLRNLWPN